MTICEQAWSGPTPTALMAKLSLALGPRVKALVLKLPPLRLQITQGTPLSSSRLLTGSTVAGRASLSVSPTTGVAAGLVTTMLYAKAWPR